MSRAEPRARRVGSTRVKLELILELYGDDFRDGDDGCVKM
jgi:hypothetical protein